ncbi:metallophosphoesterase family protein [Streptomyces olivaceus]|uniref:Metallophosphoesterase family protein n=1 Tax=Streptomyces olivaceus TaxID=47716 RepID=A0ABS7W538_STROV|nr:metallophosphoesterase family protein [Streptomyces olivaceus]MBZ6090500.1 metallophosphoesterase family protein [Streptomyces olivaceus]MBZ6096676.1 metallophosphoesterase family protein [Streptomyces olivaceus]MBZ6117674.1 metallophosphoesterase family protein [Streptomyces olivaceus]MBZ6153084.1 metallophosphoesterase family protein [Streptomyces olivaceus]MBZ6206795.1 metallophosphoesterase family protein [Streptomyces olivaceus]
MRSISSARADRSVRRRMATGATAAVLGLTVSLGGALAAPVAAADSATLTGVVLGVGADETQRTVSWYSSADTAQKIQVTPTARLTGGAFPADAAAFDALGAANTAGGGHHRNATITGLKENTGYSYRVGSEGNWSPTYSFRTQDFEGDYDFLFFGDPQIGSSGNVAKDTAGWKDTLDVAYRANPDAELLVSAGDQVESAGNESQWDGFLAPDQLRQYPVAATIGNHDVGSKAYEQHFAMPNTDRSAEYYANGDPDSNTSGGNYWYIYKDVLFIDINSNSYATSQGGGGDAAHAKYITDVVNQHGDEAKWKVLVFHHSIYSPASHAKDKDNKARRADLPATISKTGVDMVLQGHDHSYSRSYEIKDGERANPAEQPGQGDIYPGPGGVLYVTANSASGSKYYDITKPDDSGTSGSGNGADPSDPDRYWYNSVQNQEHVRSYMKVQVKSDKLVVENLRSGTCAAPNASVENGSWCNNTSEKQPVGSVVDKFTIHPHHGDGQQLQVDVPEPAPGEFGWTIDGYNGLVDLGTAKEVGGDHFTATGKINPIVVSDTRRSLSPWSVSANVSDFKDARKTFSGSYLGWSPYVLDPGAGAEAGSSVASGYDDEGKGLAVSRGLGSAEQGHARGKAKLGAGLDLKIPDTVGKGGYRATLTITALSS